jgi:SPP1 family predicted phage head-tail adaptor
MGLRAGTLRHRITVQRRSSAVDSFGQQTTTWTTVATVWASIEPSGGKELMAAQSMAIDQPSTITIRWQPMFANPMAVAAMRILYGTRIFDIHASNNPEERNRVLVLLCSEGLNDG